MNKNLLCAALVLVSLGASYQSAAEIIVGADTTELEYQLRIAPANEFYDLSPNRVRIAYMGDSVGIEAHIYEEADDRIIDYFGTLYELKLEDTLGIFARFESPQKWVFGTVGIVRTKASYGAADSGPYDRPTVILFGGSFGMQYILAKHIRFSVEYDFYTGDIDLPQNLLVAPGFDTQPSSYYKGLAAGISFSF